MFQGFAVQLRFLPQELWLQQIAGDSRAGRRDLNRMNCNGSSSQEGVWVHL